MCSVMPPRTRTRGTKTLKENFGIESKSKCHSKSTKLIRKALADKTNSLSDDNCFTKDIERVKNTRATFKNTIVNERRPRRERRLPTRFVGNDVLNNLSNSANNSIVDETTARDLKKNNIAANIIKSTTHPSKTVLETPTQNDKPLIPGTKTLSQCKNVKTSPFKTPSKDLESSLIANRPKRIHRLPSRLEDHSISPSKFIPVQPCYASTPLQKKDQKIATKDVISRQKSLKEPKAQSAFSNIATKDVKSKQKSLKQSKIQSAFSNIANKDVKSQQKSLTIPKTQSALSKAALNKKNDEPLNKSSPDTNNNPKRVRLLRQRVKACENKNQSSNISPKYKKTNAVAGKRLLDKNLSFKIVEEKQSKESGEKNLDVYEFTYDPEEEPPPQKKKKKRVIKKKTSKPKAVVFKGNYDQNVSKTLAALKNVISKKPTNGAQNCEAPRSVQNKEAVANVRVTKPIEYNIESHKSKEQVIQQKPPQIPTNKVQTLQQTHVQIATQNISNVSTINDAAKKSVHEPNYPSIRIEDIAADFESSDNHDDINYSPVNSPSRPISPNPQNVTSEGLANAVTNKDPLNLQAEVSFFDEPVACSSMNVSARHPLASPWRVEFGSLPIKWQVNSYVKSNMTPAVESSFISSENNNQKKHVYTNMLPMGNDSLPQIVESTSNLKQTSIISFIKEVAERSARKKNRGTSVTPTKANSLFEDITNTTNVERTPKNHGKNVDSNEASPNKNELNSSNDKSNEKENSKENRKRKNENYINEVPAKSPRKQRNKDCTYFGFDDSENLDQENASPSKHIHNLRVKALKPRSRAVLQEINGESGPTRAVLPVAAKSTITTSSEAMNKVYDELKSAEDAPILLDRNRVMNLEATNIDPLVIENNDIGDAECVHLFEDIDFMHHLKPTRKSYGKAKKVAFRKISNSDSENRGSDVDQSEASEVDDLADLTFTVPTLKQKRVTKKKKTKKQMTRKEEQEVEAWAAGFNSMCEDVEEFPLVVE